MQHIDQSQTLLQDYGDIRVGGYNRLCIRGLAPLESVQVFLGYLIDFRLEV